MYDAISAQRKSQTHSISQRAVTCLSTTCLTFTGSPSSCCRSPSPNREPRPIICLFLSTHKFARLFKCVKTAFLCHLACKEKPKYLHCPLVVGSSNPPPPQCMFRHRRSGCTCSPVSGPGCPAAPAAAAQTGVL